MDSVERKEKKYAKKVLMLLKDMDIISDTMFDTCYDYFYYVDELNYLNEDEKCLMAYCLSKVNILYENWNITECNRKKNELYQYYIDNKNSCTLQLEEDRQSYDKRLEKQTKLRKSKTRRINKTVFFNN